MIAVKTCSLCEETKPLEDFHKWARSKDGRMAACKECVRDRQFARGGNCEDCGKPVRHLNTIKCQDCRALAKRGAGSPQFKGGRSIKDGYVYLSGFFDHPNALRGKIAEHIVVMTAVLQRPLFQGETVHHKNGIRDDNRPENLELWTISQPPGQRVDDKIAWAKEFLESYGYIVKEV